MRRRMEVSGPAAPDVVWERYARPALWPTWSPQIRSVEAEPRLRAGSTGVVHPTVGPGIRFTVLELDEAARRWSWRVRLGPLSLVLDHEVAARDGGTVTGLVVDGPAPLVLGYAPLARLALALLVR